MYVLYNYKKRTMYNLFNVMALSANKLTIFTLNYACSCRHKSKMNLINKNYSIMGLEFKSNMS